MNLPVTMNPFEYGQVLAKEVIVNDIKYIIKDQVNRLFEVISNMEGTINNVRTLDASDLKWSDTVVSEGCFKREIGKSTIYFLDGVEVLRKQIIPSKPFRKTTVDKFLQEKFITFDIETIRKNKELIPYLICAYNGTDYAISYANSTLNQNDLFKRFLDQLLTFFNNSKKLTIYAHNLSNFDGIFLLKQLINYGEVKPLYFNNRLMSIQIKLNVEGHKGKTLLFKDSYLLLPYSLRSLCNAFSIESIKSHFPFKLTNIYYSGVFPKLEYWSGITPFQYGELKQQFKNKLWSFKDEAIRYCKLDCKILFEVLSKFNELVFGEFKINVHKHLTLPSLAVRIFKTLFMPKDTIYQLHGKPEQNIRESYSGGAVDVYIPHNRISV